MNWKNIKDYPNYQVNQYGEIRRLKATKGGKAFGLLKGYINSYGYRKIHLTNSSGKKLLSAHRLVAEAFIPNPENKPQVNHIDGNKSNNVLSNLEWCNASENQIHAIENNLTQTGEQHTNAKLTNDQAEEIRKSSLSNRVAARKYNVSKRTIQNIRQLKTYVK